MNFTEYKAAAESLSARPPDLNHPEGQKFTIGERVKIVNPQSWFAKKVQGQFFTIAYSYHQKYPEMSDGNTHKRAYALTDRNGHRSAWYDESELDYFTIQDTV